MPYIGAISGAIAGAAGEAIAVNRMSKENQPVAALLGEVSSAERESFMRRASRIGRSSLVGIGILAGGFNGYAWQPETVEVTPPFLGVVVDHSGAVGANSKIRDSVDNIVTGIDLGDIDVTAYVAGYGEVKPMDPSRVPSQEAFGDAPIESAVNTALAQARDNRFKSKDLNAGAGVLVITNGNLPGSTDALIQTAKADRTAISVVNIEGESDPAVVNELKKTAKQTGGAYFNVETAKTDQMITIIEESLEASSLIKDQPNRWPLKGLAGLSAVWAITAGFRNRRKEPTNKRLG